MERCDRPRRAQRVNIFETLEQYQTLGSDIDESDQESDLEVENNSNRSRSSFCVSDTDSDTDIDQPGPSRPKRKRAHMSRSGIESEIPDVHRSIRSRSTSPIRPPADYESDSTLMGDDDPVTSSPLNFDDWTQNLEGIPNIPQFTGESGLKFDPETISTPGDVYSLFMTKEIIKLFKSETNRYARQIIAQRTQTETMKEHSRLQDWKTVSELEIEGFLLLLIHMSLVTKHRIEDYWSLKNILHTAFAGNIMPRNRFQNILSMFHLNDNTNYVAPNEPGHDPLFKVRPFYDHLRTTFPALFVPDKNISIDEAMCGWRGKLRFKVYIKDKPVSRGIKLYMITDSVSAYVYGFEVYAMEPGVSNKPHDVCLRLLQPLLDKGYHLYVDNYYTSIHLADELQDRNTMLIGTIRQNRKEFPKDLANQKLSQDEVSFRRRRNVVVLKWKDKREVCVLSTVHDPTEKVITITRHATRDKPLAIRDYSKYMSGCDHSDQFHAYVPLRRRSLKWWKKLYIHLFVLSLVQAHILYNKVLKIKGNSKCSLHYFLLQLSQELYHSYMSKKSSDDAQPQLPVAVPSQSRLIGKHFPTLLPPTSKQKPRRACKVCTDRQKSQPGFDKASRKRTETRYWCETCQTPLCIDQPCFIDFHTKQNYID